MDKPKIYNVSIVTQKLLKNCFIFILVCFFLLDEDLKEVGEVHAVGNISSIVYGLVKHWLLKDLIN